MKFIAAHKLLLSEKKHFLLILCSVYFAAQQGMLDIMNLRTSRQVVVCDPVDGYQALDVLSHLTSFSGIMCIDLLHAAGLESSMVIAE